MVLFTIRADRIERKARDSNPHSPRGNRVSSAARPTVSGYLPKQSLRKRVQASEWTAGESNPDLLVASQASSRWTSSPLFIETRSARESNSVHLPTTEACRQRTRGPALFMNEFQSSRRESNPRSLFVREVSLPLDHGTIGYLPSPVARVGVEPTDIRLSTRSLCQFAYRAVVGWLVDRIAGPGVEPRPPGL
jgi:hypothetical protein